MTTSRELNYREWGRYQWASVDPLPVEPDVPRWNLVEWVGDQGGGKSVRQIDPADMSEGGAGFSGFRHNPGGGDRWAEGYRR